MEVILHLPKSKKLQDELAKRIATIHAQAILDSVRQLKCPTSQKIELISAVQERVRRDIDTQM